MFFYPFDWTFLILIPAFVLAIYAQSKVRSTYSKYSKVPASGRLTGREVAEMLLNQNQLSEVKVEPVAGSLSDHYDPRKRSVGLSPEVYGGRSVAALGVAAHEVGHAIQHGTGYAALTLRDGLVPVANLGSTMLFPLIIGGLLFQIRPLLDIGIILFSFAVLFQLVTLPVELDASRRAKKMLRGSGLLAEAELEPAGKVLNAAALTYLAAASVAVLTLIRLLILRGRD
jgi:Zn-dependent membrane protease YugP